MEHDVLGLDIAVDDLERVDLVDGLADLLHDGGHPGLWHGFGLLELVVELPAGAHLQNDVDVALVVEVAVHLDDVGVAQEQLDLQLPDELLRYLLLLKQSLLDHLKRAHETRATLSAKGGWYCTSETWPYLPEPSYFIFRKSPTDTTRFLPEDLFRKSGLLGIWPSSLAFYYFYYIKGGVLLPCS